MTNCPSCKNSTISNWKKTGATSAFPKVCSGCGAKYYISGWWHFSSVLSFEVIFWGSIAVSIAIGSVYAFLLVPILLISLYILVSKYSNVREISDNEIRKARIRALIEVVVVFSVIVIVVNIQSS